MTEKHCDRKELKGECALYTNANMKDCIDCNRALQKPMTEQIKSAIDIISASAECEARTDNCGHNCDDCELCYMQGTVSEHREAIALAIRSLNAWSEVLQELEELRDRFSRCHLMGEAIGVVSAIEVIKQKLEEIEEVRQA